ncbi:MAG: zinc-ribbon domain-containing protein [Anaerolineae bacterium]
MSLGAVLIGFAAAILLVTYIALPFRRRAGDVDARIEAWVAQLRRPVETETLSVAATHVEREVIPATPQASEGSVAVEPTAGPARFCHQCGSPVKPHHRFCPQCGAKLVEE